MADKTIVDLPALADPTVPTESQVVLEIVDLSEGAPADQSKKITKAQIFVRTGQKLIAGGTPKAGTTAGWVVNAADNLGKLATIPRNKTASTLVVPIHGLKVGSKITAFYLTGSVQADAAKPTVIDADLRSLTAAAAGATDASVGAIVQLSSEANAILSSVNAGKTGLSHTVADGKSYYVLITGTTFDDAANSAEIQAVTLVVQEA